MRQVVIASVWPPRNQRQRKYAANSAMLKGLFDQNLEVLTVRERGWHGRTNGDLLRAAPRDRMNPFDIELAGGSMDKAPKKKTNGRGRSRRVRYITIAGKQVKRTPRGDRLLRAVRVLKGLEVPPR